MNSDCVYIWNGFSTRVSRVEMNNDTALSRHFHFTLNTSMRKCNLKEYHLTLD
jgi:hypothetical protein